MELAAHRHYGNSSYFILSAGLLFRVSFILLACNKLQFRIFSAAVIHNYKHNYELKYSFFIGFKQLSFVTVVSHIFFALCF